MGVTLCRVSIAAAAVALQVALLAAPGSACTTVGANFGNTTFSSHTGDCQDCDFRLAKIPRSTLPAAAGTAEVYLYRRYRH